MKKRILVVLLAAFMLLSLGGVALAEEWPTLFAGEDESLLSGEASGRHLVEVDDKPYDEDNPDYRSGFLYHDDWLLQDSTMLSGDMAKVSVMLSIAAYTTSYISDLLQLMNYDVVAMEDYQRKSFDESDSVAFTVGEKEIAGRRVYCIAIRGTGGEAGAWASDFHVGDPVYNGGNHEGFYNAADRMQAKLEAAIDLSGSPILWFTGHSRGAAVANILAARYTNTLGRSNVFAYTFACPMVSKHAVTAGYENIFNFNNAGDAIPAMPLYEWGYRRYGISFDFGVQDDPAFNMRYYGENASASNTMHYEDIMRVLFPTESAVDSPYGRFFTGLLSCVLGKDHNVANVVGYVGSGLLVEQFLNPLRSRTTSYEVYQYFAGLFPKLSGYVTLLNSAVAELNEAEDEEAALSAWLSENQDKVSEIAETTGITIQSKADILTVIDLCGKQLTKVGPATLVQGAAAIADLMSDGNGNALMRIVDGHKGTTYVLGINSKFYGYEACKDFAVVKAVIPNTIRARFPNADFPVSVKTVGTRCFNGSSVESIQNTEQLEYLGTNAFSGCTNLVSLSLDSIRTLGEYALFDCTALTHVELGGHLASIGANAFRNCSSLESLYIPDSVKALGVDTVAYNFGSSFYYDLYGPFYECTGLKELSVGGVEEITCGMLKTGSAVLERLTIRGNVKRIGEDAFNSSSGYGSGANCGGYDYTSPGTTALVIEEGVESIGDCAFLGCTMFTSVSLPTSLTSIGDSSFACCSNMAGELFLPQIVNIGDGAFEDCSSLSSVTFGDALSSIGDGAFASCSNIAGELFLPQIVNIGNGAFEDCSSLSSVTFGDALSSIGDLAFKGCSSLSAVDLGSSVESIGKYAFRDCSLLERLYIPDSVKTFGAGPFYECTGLKEFSIGGVEEITGNMLETGSTVLEKLTIRGSVKKIGNNVANYRYTSPGTTVLVIEEGVESIGESAFSNCTMFTSVSLPTSLSSIDWYAFCGCSNMAGELHLPKIVSLGRCAFDGCSSLSSVTLGDELSSIGNHAFSGCSSLSYVTLGDALSSIGYCAFYGCTGLSSVTFGDALSSIGSHAFSGCSSLSYVTLGDELTTIGDNAFYGCTSLSSVTFGDALSSIGSHAFSGCSSLSTMDLGNSVESIGAGAFQNCSALEKLYIPDSVKTMDVVSSGMYTWPFYGCTGLKELSVGGVEEITGSMLETGSTVLEKLTIRGSVKKIGNNAAYYPYTSPGTTVLVIEEGVESIGDGAFSGCTMFTSVSLPTSLTSIDSYAFCDCSNLAGELHLPQIVRLGWYAFYGCSSLSSVTFGDALSYIGGNAFYGCTGLSSVTFGDELTTIGYCAFYGCTGLSSVTFGDELTTIGDNAFYGCTGLSSVTFGDELTTIGDNAFYGCTGLSSVTFGDELTTIGDNAFSGCTSLSSVTFGDELTTIGDKAFFGCSSLSSAPLGDALSHIGDSAFSGCSSLSSMTFGDALTTIGDNAFSGCSSLSAVTFGDALSSIGSYAFSGCSSLSAVTFGDALSSIGSYAFSGCSSLSAVDLGNSIESIGAYAFEKCSALEKLYIPDSVKTLGVDIDDGYLGPFYKCTGLKELSVGGVEEITCGMLKTGSAALEKLTIRGTVKRVGEDATHSDWWFGSGYDCNGYHYTSPGTTALIIEEGVEAIGDRAFQGCTIFTAVFLPSSLSTIGTDAFSGCNFKQEVAFTGNRFDWSTIQIAGGNGALFDAGIVCALSDPAPDFKPPAALLTIEDEAFRGCAFSYVKLGENATKIGDLAFAESPKLRYVYIPASVTAIGTDAFKDTAPGLTILTPSDSFAESYAKANNIRFGVIDNAA